MSLSILVNIASVVFALIGCTLCVYNNYNDLSNMKLEDLVNFALAASTIPMGLVLIVSGIYPNIIKNLNGLNIYYSLAGLSLLFVSVKTLLT
ncbi:hypothetical protein GCM10027342_53800 [Photobacterium alginatilyticum]